MPLTSVANVTIILHIYILLPLNLISPQGHFPAWFLPAVAVKNKPCLAYGDSLLWAGFLLIKVLHVHNIMCISGPGLYMLKHTEFYSSW